jgi:multiple sugar transport system substrate-binding protein
MKFYGWKNPAGQFQSFVDWAKAAGLAAPYPSFFTDPAVKAAFPSYYDLPMISNIFANGSEVVPARTLPWYESFVTTCGNLVQGMLIGQSTPAKTVTALASAAHHAKSGTGL